MLCPRQRRSLCGELSETGSVDFMPGPITEFEPAFDEPVLRETPPTREHREAAERKHHRIEGLTALIATWEAVPTFDPDYRRALTARLASAKSQLRAMKP